MRILVCPSAFYPSFGGVEEIARNLGKTLSGLGHSVAVVVNRWPGTPPTFERLFELDSFRFISMVPCWIDAPGDSRYQNDFAGVRLVEQSLSVLVYIMETLWTSRLSLLN